MRFQRNKLKEAFLNGDGWACFLEDSIVHIITGIIAATCVFVGPHLMMDSEKIGV